MLACRALEIESSTTTCWARSVSDCSDEALPASADGKAVLCAKHRAGLAPLGHALIDLNNAMREVERLREVRKGLSRAWTPVRLTVDGAGIERAVLRLALEHAAVRPPEAAQAWQPPAWLPAAIFGRQPLLEGCGAALVVRVGDSIYDSERTAFSLAQSDSSGLYQAAVLELREGWKLVCTWDTPIAELGTLRFGAESYRAGEDTLFHPRRVSFKNRDIDLAISLDFDWSGRWTTSKYPNIAKLRK